MNRRILLILILGFTLRIAAIHFGLPNLFHADEPIVVNHALAFGSGDFNPHFFKIPPLTSYLLFFLYGIYYILGRGLGFFHSLQDFETLFYSNPTSFYLIGRIFLGAILGTVTIWFFYKSIRKHFARQRAELAALFFSIFFLHVRDSHYIYADIPLILTMVLAFSKFWDFCDRPTVRNAVLSSLWVGVAASFKYNGIFLALPFVLILLSTGHERMRCSLAASLSFLGVAFALNPYAFLDSSHFFKEIALQNKSLGGVGWMHHLKYSLPGAAGLPMLAVAFAGVFGSFLKKDVKRLSFLIFAVGYYAVLALKGQAYDRYVLPLVPVIAFFAADYVLSSVEVLPGRKKKVLTLFVLAVSLPSLVRCGLWMQLMEAKDTRVLAKEWVEAHIPKDSKVALDWDFYMPHLAMSGRQLEEKWQSVLQSGNFSVVQQRRLEFMIRNSKMDKPQYDLYEMVSTPSSGARFLFAKPEITYDLAELKSRGIQYVITGNFSQEPSEMIQSFHRDLEIHGERLVEFSPYRDPSIKAPLDAQPLTGGPFLLSDLKARARNGQPLQIYRLT